MAERKTRGTCQESKPRSLEEEAAMLVTLPLHYSWSTYWFLKLFCDDFQLNKLYILGWDEKMITIVA